MGRRFCHRVSASVLTPRIIACSKRYNFIEINGLFSSLDLGSVYKSRLDSILYPLVGGPADQERNLIDLRHSFDPGRQVRRISGYGVVHFLITPDIAHNRLTRMNAYSDPDLGNTGKYFGHIKPPQPLEHLQAALDCAQRPIVRQRIWGTEDRQDPIADKSVHIAVHPHDRLGHLGQIPVESGDDLLWIERLRE